MEKPKIPPTDGVVRCATPLDLRRIIINAFDVHCDEVSFTHPQVKLRLPHQ